jgi:putative acetyltransferase
LHLVGVAGGHVIASGGIFPLAATPRRRHAAGLGLSVAAEWQRRGIGSEMIRRLLEWSDRWLGYLRIELTVYTDNERAIRLYEKFGFAVEGRYRAFALRDGVFVDALAMARLHPDPPQLPRG